MGRMGGMTETISQLMNAMGLDVSPWVAPLLALLLFFALLPKILRNMRTSKARKILKRAWMLGAEERTEMERAAVTLVRGHPPGMLALGQEAQRQGRFALARLTVSELKETRPKRGTELWREMRKLDQALTDQLPNTEDELVLMVERLMELDMWEEAERRLDQGRARWPNSNSISQLDRALKQR